MALCQYISAMAMGGKRQGEFHLPGKNVAKSSKKKMGVIKTGKKLGRHFVGSFFK